MAANAGRGANGTIRIRSSCRWSRRRAALAAAWLPTITADASRSCWARSRCPNRSCERTLERSGHLPRRQVEQGHDDRQARRDRQRTAANRVVDGAGRSAALGPPGGAQRRAAQEEWIDGHRGRSQQPGWRQQAPSHDLEMVVAARRVVEVGAQEDRERLAGDRLGVERPQQGVEVDRGQRGPLRGLERARVEDDPDAAWHRGDRGAETADRAVAHDRRPPGSSRSRSSSARSWTTTTSASATIRRLIFDWPMRRSRKVIGTSRIRAPARDGPERHLDLEDVATGMDAANGTAARVAARQALNPPVRSPGREAQHGAGEQAPAAGDDPSTDAPVDHAAAARVARADDEVRRALDDRRRRARAATPDRG